MVKKVSPLQTGRFYKVKKPTNKFLCALCSAPREMKYGKNLSIKNYLQIFVLSASLSAAAFPFIGLKSLFLIFLVFPSFEIINKLMYRKDIPCPYCGFDATWYRRDVTVANRIVKDYWQRNYPELVQKSGELDQEQLEAAQNLAAADTFDLDVEQHSSVI